MLQKIRPFGAKTDHLFIGTLRFQYFAVAWNPDTRQLDTVQSFIDVSERHIQNSQSRDRCLVDPGGKQLVMELFQGILNLVKIVKPRKSNKDYLDKPEQVRITEMKVRACTFLNTETNRPKLAILYDAGKVEPDIRLATYRVVDEKSQYSSFDPHKDRENELDDLDIGASHLIPVAKGETEQKRYIVRNATGAKAQLGGVIIVGETKMVYLDDESRAIVEYPLEEASVWVAWERYDDLHYLLADNYARLHLLTIEVDGAVVIGLDVQEIGTITKATVLVYMGEGILFIGSHEGNSQVIRLDLESNDQNIEVLQTMANIAPILDFTVMDMGSREGQTQTNEYSSGQARLVTGSGGWEDGSLRSVRSGVGLDDVGILDDIEDVTGLFALRSSECSRGHDIVVISLPIETRILMFDSHGEIEELDNYRGFSLDVQTLLAINLPNDCILQVTTATAMILNPRGVAARWTPPAGQVLTAASANEHHLLLAANGITLVTLDIKRQLIEVQVGESLTDRNQVGCIHVPSHIPNIGVVGFWKSGTVSVLNLTTLAVLHSVDLRKTDSASIPRNIALTQVLPDALSGPTLFVAMEDGIVHTFNVEKETFALSGKKSIVLGTQQAQFQVLPGKDGLYNIFATCEHPSLIYGSEGRIVYSAVTADTATHVCYFDSEAYPDSIIVATTEQLKISQIDTERRTHVRTMPMGETVRRIAYSSNERAFGIGSVKRELIQGEEVITSTFRLVEEVMFGEMGKPVRLHDSVGTELIECVVRAELPTAYGDGQPAERFIVGTSYLDEDVEQDVRGKILVFGVDNNRNPYLIMSHALKGACRCLAILDGKIVAALVKTVVMYTYEESTETCATLTKIATYRTSTCPIALDVTHDIIAIGDLMKSVSLVQYVPGKNGEPDTLQELARHMQSLWTTAVVHIEAESYLMGDHLGNLVVLRRNPNGLLLEDRKRLEVTSSLNLGEQVNKIAPIHIDASPKAMVVPRAFLATVSPSLTNPFTIQDLIAPDRRLNLSFQHDLCVVARPVNPAARTHGAHCADAGQYRL
jgi:DNA damage-binding protein 1